jgi:CubicO group peptidase (beta-lactamase class C family)
MIRFARFAALIVFSTLTALLPAQTVNQIDPALGSRIDRIAHQVLEQTGVPSASLAIVQHGKLVYTHAYGSARLASAGRPALAATPEMRYSVGSISKQFAAAALLMLQQEGKLKLDDPVGEYLPGLTRGNEVTIRQILSHTAGYQDYYAEDYTMTPMQSPTTPQHILDTWAKKPLDFEPGTQWQYSNTNYVLAGQIVEHVTGHPLMDLLTERVFRPLGMHSVWNSDEIKLTATDAEGYYRHALGPLRPSPREGRGWMFSAGELAMTAHDLALWDISLLSQSVLSPESYKEMYKEIKLKDGKGTGYALGLDVEEQNGHRIVGHTGEVSGFVSANDVLLDDGAAIAVLTNQDAVGAASQIVRLVEPLLGGAQPTPAEQQALAIYHGLQQGQLDRSQLAPNLNDYFSAEAVEDYRGSLSPLGEPLSFRQTSESLRGGMTFRAFQIVYPGRRLRLTTYTMPDGKLEQYIVAPVD